MADRKASAGKSGMNVDTALVRELAEMLGDTGLTEVEVEDGVLTLKGEKKSQHEEAASGPRRIETRSGRFERRSGCHWR